MREKAKKISARERKENYALAQTDMVKLTVTTTTCNISITPVTYQCHASIVRPSEVGDGNVSVVYKLYRPTTFVPDKEGVQMETNSYFG